MKFRLLTPILDALDIKERVSAYGKFLTDNCSKNYAYMQKPEDIEITPWGICYHVRRNNIKIAIVLKKEELFGKWISV